MTKPAVEAASSCRLRSRVHFKILEYFGLIDLDLRFIARLKVEVGVEKVERAT